MKIKIEFNLDNSAYVPDYPRPKKDGRYPKQHLEPHLNLDAIVGTIKNVCNQIEQSNINGSILDPNGNTVGTWSIKPTTLK